MTTIISGLKTLFLFGLTIAVLILLVVGIVLGPTHPLIWVLGGTLTIIPYIHDRIANKSFVEWNDSLTTGIESLDNDRKKLLGLVNQLQTAAHYSVDTELKEQNLLELFNHTKQYLSNEENLMKDCGCKDLKECKKQHAIMLSKIDEYLEMHNRKESLNLNKIVLFIKTWVINHIHASNQYISPLKNIEAA